MESNANDAGLLQNGEVSSQPITRSEGIREPESEQDQTEGMQDCFTTVVNTEPMVSGEAMVGCESRQIETGETVRNGTANPGEAESTQREKTPVDNSQIEVIQAGGEEHVCNDDGSSGGSMQVIDVTNVAQIDDIFYPTLGSPSQKTECLVESSSNMRPTEDIAQSYTPLPSNQQAVREEPVSTNSTSNLTPITSTTTALPAVHPARTTVSVAHDIQSDLTSISSDTGDVTSVTSPSHGSPKQVAVLKPQTVAKLPRRLYPVYCIVDALTPSGPYKQLLIPYRDTMGPRYVAFSHQNDKLEPVGWFDDLALLKWRCVAVLPDLLTSPQAKSILMLSLWVLTNYR